MAANQLPVFTITPVIGKVTISTANTARDGTGTIGTVITGGTNGTRITKIIIQAIGTTTAGIVRLFYKTGASIHLFKEIAITAITGNGTVPEFATELDFFGEKAIVLPSGWTIEASTHNAESFNVIAEGGDY